MRDYKNGTGQDAGATAPRNILSTGRYRWLIGGITLPLIALLLMLPDDEPAVEAEEELVAAEIVAPEVITPVEEPQVIAKSLPLPAKDSTPAEKPLPILIPANTKPAQTTASLPSVALPKNTLMPADEERIVLTVRSGDTLDRLFRRNDLSISDLHSIMNLKLAKEHLRMIRPGDQLEVFHQKGEITAVHREIDLWESLAVTLDGETYTAEVFKNAIEHRPVEASGRIEDSLYLAGEAAGLPPKIIMELAGLFSWDIDFILEVRRGDEFVVIYDELWRDGKNMGPGDIVAAQFINQGDSFVAVRFEDPEGRVNYYSPDGANMRKAFLRAPLDVFRVSSNFNPNRRHPVLNTIRAHKGVDYAAGRGTPIKAAGDGKVDFRGVKGGYGNTVILSHGGNITTLYAHMDKFSRAAKSGARVRQGQIIGYVGSSGLATGPHLHYEYRKNGVHMNPRTVKLPAAKPIDPAYLADFRRISQPLVDRLNSQRQMLASNSSATNSN